MTIYQLTTYGQPQPKGSLKCIGKRGKAQHVLIEDDKTGMRKVWREQLTESGKIVTQKLGHAIDGPVVVGVVTFISKPKSNRQSHPLTRSSGDVDKHARMTLDALDDAGIYTDDSRVVMVLSAKAWAEEPGRERAVVFVGPAEERSPLRVLDAMLRVAPALKFTRGVA